VLSFALLLYISSFLRLRRGAVCLLRILVTLALIIVISVRFLIVTCLGLLRLLVVNLFATFSGGKALPFPPKNVWGYYISSGAKAKVLPRICCATAVSAYFKNVSNCNAGACPFFALVAPQRSIWANFLRTYVHLRCIWFCWWVFPFHFFKYFLQTY